MVAFVVYCNNLSLRIILARRRKRHPATANSWHRILERKIPRFIHEHTAWARKERPSSAWETTSTILLKRAFSRKRIFHERGIWYLQQANKIHSQRIQNKRLSRGHNSKYIHKLTLKNKWPLPKLQRFHVPFPNRRLRIRLEADELSRTLHFIQLRPTLL